MIPTGADDDAGRSRRSNDRTMRQLVERADQGESLRVAVEEMKAGKGRQGEGEGSLIGPDYFGIKYFHKFQR